MFSFINNVITYLEANLQLGTIIKHGVLDETSKAITIRLTPSSAGERYLEGRNDVVSFQILVKDTSNQGAIEKLDNITKALDGATITGVDNLINIQVYTTANFVEKTVKNEFIYTALFQAELEGVN